MTKLARVMSLWPWVYGAAVLATLVTLPWATPLAVYLLPPLAYRLHERWFPLREGASVLSEPTYSPWWGGHQIQVPFIAFPALEAILRLTGLYSPWLRLWGARIGRRVYWTPLIEITDRALLEIGDDVIIGHKCGFYAHAIRPARGRLYLYARRIRIGSGCFLGAGSGFGPGASVPDNTYLPFRTEVYPGKTARPDTQGPRETQP
jgi:acetyltransferase-like isoleucine patch superfamily enzyme